MNASRKDQAVIEVADETTSLLRPPAHGRAPTAADETPVPETRIENGAGEPGNVEKPFPKDIINVVFPVLLLGVLLANGDGSMMIATNHNVASEFNALSSAAWLLTTYTLGSCASQPLYGKLSDIYGRKVNLAVSWVSFSIGCLIVGIGRTFWQILVGRAVSGIGAAGMTALTSIIITDLLPLRYVAQYRAYINFTATMARSVGGPVGAWIAQSKGWRICFVWQCPLALCGLAFVLLRLPESNSAHAKAFKIEEENSRSSKLSRVDFRGAIALAGTIVTGMLALSQGTRGLAWCFLVPLIAGFIIFGSAFILIEKHYAKEPILPLELISKRDVLTSYLIILSQAAGQFGLLYGIPIYFQIASNASIAESGTRIVPVVIGNAVGTIAAGSIISKFSRYKPLTLFGLCCSLSCFTLMCFRWRGSTTWLESSCVFLAGYGMGTSQSTTFVHLAASLERTEMAIAGTTWFLAQSMGSLIGASFDIALTNAVLGSRLRNGLRGIDNQASIIKRVTSNLGSISKLPADVQSIVKRAYITSLMASDGLSMFFVVCALVVALSMRERSL